MQVIQFVNALCVDEGKIKFAKYFDTLHFLMKPHLGSTNEVII